MPTREKRRRRGRPSNAERAAELPPVPAMFSEEATNASEAVAALDVAEKSSAADSDAPPAPETPAAIASADKPRAPVSPDRSTLTGRSFKSMQRLELSTALQISERENKELRDKLATITPAASGQKLAAMERMCGTAISALFDLAALVTGIDEVQLDKEEEAELGELGAPALAPYMRDYVQHAPLIAFGSKLATVITAKVFTVKAEKAIARKVDADE